jgi:hypothetical protein
MNQCRKVLVCAVCNLWAAGAAAQDLSPRAYWPAPKGTRVAVFGYAYASGDVLTDPSLPVYGVDSRISTGFLAYMQTFGLWKRTTNVVVELPYTWGTTEGVLYDQSARGEFSGFGDLSVTLAVNLRGAPSMTPSEFQELRADPRPLLGASLEVVAPTGRYDGNRLLNVGANRWAIRPELGSVIPLTPRWLLELEAGVCFFGDDDAYVSGRREQDPIFAGEVHLVRRFEPGFWASLEANYFEGGRQTIGGNELGDVQRNMRMGGTVVVPVRRRHAVKLGYSQGVITESGTDFYQFLVSYSVVF